MNEIVKFENQFNNVALKKFTANQLNLLLGICSRMKEKGQDNIMFDFQYLKKLIKLDKNYTTEEFIKEITSVNKKLLALNFTFETTNEIIQFALFSVFKINKKELTLKVQVNSEFSFLLNNLTSNFTRFELEEFVNFKSSYTKEFFRRMKQFRNTGIYRISVEEFRRLFDIPKSYKISHIDSFVLAPILEELKDKYNLNLKKIYKSKGVGRPTVSDFEFTFYNSSIVDKLEAEYEKNNKKILNEIKQEKIEKENLEKLKFVENCKDYKDFVGKTFSIFDGSKGKFDLYEIIKIEKLDDEKIKIHLKNLANNEIRTKTYQNENEMISSFKNRLVK